MKSFIPAGILAVTFVAQVGAQISETNRFRVAPLLEVTEPEAARTREVMEEKPQPIVPSPTSSGDVQTPFARPLAGTTRANDHQPPIDDVQREQALRELLREVGRLYPGDYNANEKLLEVLQLERLQALREQEAERSKALPQPLTPAALEASVQRAVALRTSLWPTQEIAVSWDVSQETFERYGQERQWVRDAVRASWERESAVRFTGWGRATGEARGIRISIEDDGPHCKGLGRNLDGTPAGMVLNFTFQNWCRACGIERKNSIQYIAVHEFGHALGLAHEQNRDDAPTWCQAHRQGSDGDWRLTVYDPQSVMNYCSDRWNNDGRLTELDKRAIRVMYGDPHSTVDGGNPEVPFPRPWREVENEPDSVPQAARLRQEPTPARRPIDSPANGEGDLPARSPRVGPPAESGASTQQSKSGCPVCAAAARPTAAKKVRSTRISALFASTSRRIPQPQQDLARLDQLIRGGVGAVKKAYNIDVRYDDPPKLIGTEIGSRQALFDRIDQLAGGEDCTVICYLKFHGRDERGRHVIELDALDGAPPEIVTRNEMVDRLLSRKARLTAVITESCRLSEVEFPRVTPQTTDFPVELFDHLFLCSAGVLDINSASAGQAGWTVGDEGLLAGVVWKTFMGPAATQQKILARIDRDGDRVYPWEEYFGYLTEAIDERFQNLKTAALREGSGVDAGVVALLEKQARQTPEAFAAFPTIAP